MQELEDAINKDIKNFAEKEKARLQTELGPEYTVTNNCPERPIKFTK